MFSQAGFDMDKIVRRWGHFRRSSRRNLGPQPTRLTPTTAPATQRLRRAALRARREERGRRHRELGRVDQLLGQEDWAIAEGQAVRGHAPITADARSIVYEEARRRRKVRH